MDRAPGRGPFRARDDPLLDRPDRDLLDGFHIRRSDEHCVSAEAISKRTSRSAVALTSRLGSETAG